MALCATTALAGAVSRLCVRGARGRLGGVRAGTWCCVSPSSPFLPRVFRAACGGPSLILARWYAIPCGLCVPRARSGCPSGGPRVSFSCVCARALAVSAPRWVVWRAHLAWSRHWALVGPFHVVRAPPRVLPRTRAPSGVLGGGGLVPVPPYLAWGCGGGGRASPGGCLRPSRGVFGVLRSSSPDCPSTGWAVGVCVVGAGVRLWGPRSVPVGGERGVDLVSRRRSAGFP